MTITVSEYRMTSDLTPHTARHTPGQDSAWEVSWLSGRRLTRNEAITAMTLAEAGSPARISDRTRMRPFIEDWSQELGITAGHAMSRIAASPAWVPAAEPSPGRADPEAGQ